MKKYEFTGETKELNGKMFTLTAHANHPVMQNIIQNGKRHYPMLGVLEIIRDEQTNDSRVCHARRQGADNPRS